MLSSLQTWVFSQIIPRILLWLSQMPPCARCLYGPNWTVNMTFHHHLACDADMDT